MTDDLKAFTTFAPDTRIGQGEWTGVVSVMDEAFLFWDNHAFSQQIGLIA